MFDSVDCVNPAYRQLTHCPDPDHESPEADSFARVESMPILIRTAGLMAAVTLLQSCGGGSGDGGVDGGSDGRTRLGVSPMTINVAATPGEAGPTGVITLNITNPPVDGLYVGSRATGRGIEDLDFRPTSATQARIRITFKPPGMLLNDTYEDEIELHVCHDSQCQQEVGNSPQSVRTAYVVSGDGLANAAIARTSILVMADQRESSERTETSELTLDVYPPSGIFVSATHSTNALDFVGVNTSASDPEVFMRFLPASALSIGTHNDSIGVQICYHRSCVRQVKGSPLAIDTRFAVSIGVEPGVPQLLVEHREPLAHNVIAAEYSKSMNAIVMISNVPVNALYVYDVASGTESQQDLAAVPQALAIAPDGAIAAVGHEWRLSVVDLPSVGAPGAPEPVVWDIDTVVDQMILDGSGRVHAAPPQGWVDFIHSIDIATGVDRHSDFAELRRLRLDPRGDAFYALQSHSPDDVSKWDISAGFARYIRTWPDARDHDACLNLWLSEDGEAIYTACGETFNASTDPAQDMTYAGTLSLSPPTSTGRNTIRSLSHSASSNEIAVIERNPIDCDPSISFQPCFSRLATYAADTLERKAVYGIGPVTTGGTSYAQVGRHVFHNTANGRKYLITQLEDAPSPDQRFWLSVIQ